MGRNVAPPSSPKIFSNDGEPEHKITLHKPTTFRHTEWFRIPRSFTKYGTRTRKYYVPWIFNALEQNQNFSSIQKVEEHKIILLIQDT